MKKPNSHKKFRSNWLQGPRPWLLLVVGVLIFFQLVVLSPNPLEVENKEDKAPTIKKAELVLSGINASPPKAPDIPRDRVPDYEIEQLQHVSVERQTKQWKLIADEASLFNDIQLVHAKRVHADLYNPDGSITVVTGDEARYFMDRRDLEIFGNVVTRFEDGFILNSPYMRYRPKDRLVEIPPDHFVQGIDESDDGKILAFNSYGLHYDMKKNHVLLNKKVIASMTKKNMSKESEGTAGIPEKTTIRSDYCLIDRNSTVAHFKMDPHRVESDRFVQVQQPTLATRSRQVELWYGDSGKDDSLLRYMVAIQDVLIRELDTQSTLKYATCGRAEFDKEKNDIFLKEFPQVYQDNDTVTGEVILLHRDTDIVEVEHSNAFSEGRK